MEMIVVGAGDFIGAILRFWITKSSSGMVTFPLGTLLSNVLAALCIGIIVGLDQHYLFFSPRTRQFLTMGVLGG